MRSLKALVTNILPKAGMNSREFKLLTDRQPSYLLLMTWGNDADQYRVVVAYKLCLVQLIWRLPAW